jgi:hypothetical protein
MTDKLLHGYLVDPYTKTIKEVYVSPYPAWKALIEVDMIEAVTIARYADGTMETLWIDEEGLLHDKADGPYIKVKTHPQPMAGKGIILGTDAQGETVNSKLPMNLVQQLISFPTDVRFTGFEALPETTVVLPGIGEMTQIGHRAVFEKVKVEPLDEEDAQGD